MRFTCYHTNPTSHSVNRAGVSQAEHSLILFARIPHDMVLIEVCEEIRDDLRSLGQKGKTPNLMLGVGAKKDNYAGSLLINCSTVV